jgi:hypothetical protein
LATAGAGWADTPLPVRASADRATAASAVPHARNVIVIPPPGYGSGMVILSMRAEDVQRYPPASVFPGRRAHRWGPWSCTIHEREAEMLYTLAVILLIAWLLGVVGTYTIGAFIHVLLVIAIVLFLVGLLSGRTTV